MNVPDADLLEALRLLDENGGSMARENLPEASYLLSRGWAEDAGKDALWRQRVRLTETGRKALAPGSPPNVVPVSFPPSIHLNYWTPSTPPASPAPAQSVIPIVSVALQPGMVVMSRNPPFHFATVQTITRDLTKITSINGIPHTDISYTDNAGFSTVEASTFVRQYEWQGWVPTKHFPICLFCTGQPAPHTCVACDNTGLNAIGLDIEIV